MPKLLHRKDQRELEKLHTFFAQLETDASIFKDQLSLLVKKTRLDNRDIETLTKIASYLTRDRTQEITFWDMLYREFL